MGKKRRRGCEHLASGVHQTNGITLSKLHVGSCTARATFALVQMRMGLQLSHSECGAALSFKPLHRPCPGQ